MDHILFSLKRAYQGSLRAGHELTKEFGLTPARFDLMFVLKEHRDEVPYFMTQRELRNELGVSAPTVSRMLRSLERLGLIWRGPRRYRWGRSREVALSRRGRALIRRAAKRVFYNQRARRLVDRALRRGPNKRDDLMRRDELDEKLSVLRRFFGDVATHYYPWHPDD